MCSVSPNGFRVEGLAALGGDGGGIAPEGTRMILGSSRSVRVEGMNLREIPQIFEVAQRHDGPSPTQSETGMAPRVSFSSRSATSSPARCWPLHNLSRYVRATPSLSATSSRDIPDASIQRESLVSCLRGLPRGRFTARGIRLSLQPPMSVGQERSDLGIAE